MKYKCPICGKVEYSENDLYNHKCRLPKGHQQQKILRTHIEWEKEIKNTN